MLTNGSSRKDSNNRGPRGRREDTGPVRQHRVTAVAPEPEPPQNERITEPRPRRPLSGPPGRRENSGRDNRTPRIDRRVPRDSESYDLESRREGPPWRKRRGPRVPGWLVVVVAVLLAAGGIALGEPYFQIAVVLGSVLAALVVDRSAFFAAAVQPPLITAIVATGAVFLGLPWLDAATEVARSFPYLVATMVAVLVILFVRGRMSPARRA